jgi:hypothetical protein
MAKVGGTNVKPAGKPAEELPKPSDPQSLPGSAGAPYWKHPKAKG